MGTEAPQDLRGWLNSVEHVVDVAEFSEGDAAFEVRIRRTDKKLLTELYNACVKDKGRDRAGNPVKEHDTKKFREGIRRLLVGWDGLTYRKLALATGRNAASLNGVGDTPVEFTTENAMIVLEVARGVVGDRTVAFEDWVFEKATAISTAAEAEECQAGEG